MTQEIIGLLGISVIYTVMVFIPALALTMIVNKVNNKNNNENRLAA